MTQSFFVPGPLPSLNDILDGMKSRFRNGKTAYGVLKMRWEQTIGIMTLKYKVQPVLKPVKVSFEWFEQDLRRDVDGISGGGRKLILDALVRHQILVNDSQKYVKQLSDTFHVNKYAPGCKVTIEEL